MAKQLSAQNLIKHAHSHAERAINSTMVEACEDNTALLSGAPNSRHTMS